jgi:hypothetical protein
MLSKRTKKCTKRTKKCTKITKKCTKRNKRVGGVSSLAIKPRTPNKRIKEIPLYRQVFAISRDKYHRDNITKALSTERTGQSSSSLPRYISSNNEEDDEEDDQTYQVRKAKERREKDALLKRR